MMTEFHVGLFLAGFVGGFAFARWGLPCLVDMWEDIVVRLTYWAHCRRMRSRGG